MKSKTLATWIAVLGGSLGLHRFYLHGFRDPWGWLFPAPTLAGVHGVLRLREFGQDDRLAWVLVPLLGLTVSIAMLSALIYGLTPDERWDARHNAGRPSGRSGWAVVFAVIVALMVGAGVLMATIAFSSEHFFRWQLTDAAGR